MQDPQYSRLVSRIAMAPRAVRGQDFSAEGAVREMILSLWKKAWGREQKALLHKMDRALDKAARGELELALQELTLKIKTLEKGWEASRPLLEN